MLKMSIGSLLASGLWPGTLEAQNSPASGAFRFIVLNDIHYLDARSGTWLEQRVLPQFRRVERRPHFVIIAGDLADNGTAAELGPVRDIFQSLHIPVHVVVGNHDYRTQTDRKFFDDLFPNQLNYTFAHDGWQFIGLDTSEGLRYQNTSVNATTLRWLDDNLPRLDRKRPTVVFTHFPLGPGVTNRPRNADDVLNRLRTFNLQGVFCGHYHALTERLVGQTLITTNRCCSISRGNHDNSRQKGYFSCQTEDGRVKRMFVEVTPA